LTPQVLKNRTKAFALRVIKLVNAMPHSRAGEVIGKQLLRSATSVGANYGSACRAQSRADFAAKVAVVAEEADESLYWLELVVESGLIKPERLGELLKGRTRSYASNRLAQNSQGKTKPIKYYRDMQSSICNRQSLIR
jgi:four helix bundle protein